MQYKPKQMSSFLRNFAEHVYQDLHYFYGIFRVLKGSKKDGNMMSCNILYVKYKEDVIGQVKKISLLSFMTE